MRRADPAPFDRAEIAGHRVEIGSHHQEPVHALRLRAQQLGAMPFRKAADHEMRGAAEKFEAAVVERRKRLFHRHHELKLDVEAFALEHPEFDRGDDREIGI